MKPIVRNPILVLVFSIITCGIYFLYWIYATSNDIKNYLNDSNINPVLELLISIICFPYMFYWFYKYAKLVSTVQQTAGIEQPEDNSVLCVILPFLGLSVVSALIIQSGLNKAWEK